MAIEQGIWKLAGTTGELPQKLRPMGLADEGLLEEQIMRDVSILNRDWLLIGRQVRTGFDKLIDLLAIDANGTVIVIELKRDKTPRDVVAQAIDYASWLVTLADYQLIEIYQVFAERYQRPHTSLEEAFEAKFGIRWIASPSTRITNWSSSPPSSTPVANGSSTTSTRMPSSRSTLCSFQPSRIRVTTISAAPG